MINLNKYCCHSIISIINFKKKKKENPKLNFIFVLTFLIPFFWLNLSAFFFQVINFLKEK